tara:strand:- start:885 stop:1142 length:258 start_codon:yes stop_codon:yes gene_type:complete
MNDKALYQLERAIDALKLMAEALREEQTNDTISFSTSTTGDVVFSSSGDDDIINLDKFTLRDIILSSSDGNINIDTGTEGNITFS